MAGSAVRGDLRCLARFAQRAEKKEIARSLKNIRQVCSLEKRILKPLKETNLGVDQILFCLYRPLKHG